MVRKFITNDESGHSLGVSGHSLGVGQKKLWSIKMVKRNTKVSHSKKIYKP